MVSVISSFKFDYDDLSKTPLTFYDPRSYPYFHVIITIPNVYQMYTILHCAHKLNDYAKTDCAKLESSEKIDSIKQ